MGKKLKIFDYIFLAFYLFCCCCCCCFSIYHIECWFWRLSLFSFFSHLNLFDNAFSGCQLLLSCFSFSFKDQYYVAISSLILCLLYIFVWNTYAWNFCYSVRSFLSSTSLFSFGVNYSLSVLIISSMKIFQVALFN